MTLAALAVALVVAVTVVLGVTTVSLSRQVRRLTADVQVLASRRPPASEPIRQDELVLTPTPIGPAEVEPDLRVSRVASVTLAGPLIKVAAFSHGVRRALTEESRMRAAYAFRKELRRQRKVRRKRAASGPPGKEGRRP